MKAERSVWVRQHLNVKQNIEDQLSEMDQDQDFRPDIGGGLNVETPMSHQCMCGQDEMPERAEFTWIT